MPPGNGFVLKVGIAVALFTAAGVFIGNLGWGAYQARAVEAAAAAASAAAAAEAIAPLGRQRAAVRRVLHDPDSAVFRGEKAAPRDPTVWCGEVNARNRMGGMVGFSRYVVVLSEHLELADVLDEARIEGLSSDSGALAVFEQRHRALCR